MSLHLVSPSGPAAAVHPAPARSPRKGAALRLVSTKDLEREDWLEVRRTGIGSSDAAAAIGLNPYQSQLELWMQKTGKGDLLPAVDLTLPLESVSHSWTTSRLAGVVRRASFLRTASGWCRPASSAVESGCTRASRPRCRLWPGAGS